MFFDDLERFGRHTALRDDRKTTVTYHELALRCDQINEKKEGKRSLVLCLCRNEIDSVTGYISCLRNRDVPMLLNAEIDQDLCRNLIAVYRPQYLFVPKELAGRFPAFVTTVSLRDYVLLHTGYEKEKMSGELALLLATSGSTGSPKFVRQSYRNLQSNALSIAGYLELHQEERPVTTLPMNYTYGLSIINSHLLAGATLLMTEHSLVKKEFWAFLQQEKATSFGGVPYTYEMLKKIRFFEMDMPYLKTMTQAGGKLRPELHKEFAEYARDTGKRFVVMYGQTEATARMAYLPADKALEKWGSMGKAIPGGRLWLRDEAGRRITERDVVGELIYEGENVTLGYAEQRADLEKGDERKGLLETGDMAKMDEDGFFYIVGRKKRFLKVFGNRVNLDEVENLLKAEFQLNEIACAGKDDRLCIFILKDSGIEAERILHFISDKTRLNRSAFSFFETGEIPRSEAGKILYNQLEKFYDGL